MKKIIILATIFLVTIVGAYNLSLNLENKSGKSNLLSLNEVDALAQMEFEGMFEVSGSEEGIKLGIGFQGRTRRVQMSVNGSVQWVNKKFCEKVELRLVCTF